MMEAAFELLYLFFVYSFVGWILETAAAAVRERRYVDRSVLYGPLCMIYGITMAVLTFAAGELKETPFFLFVNSAVYAIVVEWVAGHILEHATHTRWWDYSGHFANLDGYISLPMSVLWGLLATVAVYWGNPLLLRFYHLIPSPAMHLILWAFFSMFLADVLGSVLTFLGLRHRLPRLEGMNNRIEHAAVWLGDWILVRTERRMQRAHPEILLKRVCEKREEKRVFAEGLCFYKIVLLFAIGSLLGDITETVFCRLRAGVWMSRSSLVWDPFSIIWGLAIALVTMLLYRDKDRSDRFLFLMGTVLGGAYEYFCSVMTERLFGTVFWDYSEIPFNLEGRINLLYCFFWGFAAVVWFKVLYPPFSGWIEALPRLSGTIVTWAVFRFLICDMAMSAMTLARYDLRSQGLAPQSGWERYIDEHYGDDVIAHVHPNALRVE